MADNKEWRLPIHHSFWLLSPFQKFCLGFGICTAAALLWHIGIFFQDGAWIWAKHELTFSFAHIFLFGPAVGLVLSILNKDFIEHLSLLELLLLPAMLAVVAWLSFNDSLTGPPNKLHYLVGFLETWFFMSVVAVYLWYDGIALTRGVYNDTTPFARLAGAMFLMALWIPLRIYATKAVDNVGNPTALFATFQAPNNPPVNGPSFLALSVFLIALVVLIVFALSAHGKLLDLRVILSVLGILWAVIAAMVVKQSAWIPPLFLLVEQMTPQYFVVICILLTLSEFVIASKLIA